MDFANRALRRDVSDWRDEHSVAAAISLHQLHYALNAWVARALEQGGSWHASKWAELISKQIEPHINEVVRTRVDSLMASARAAMGLSGQMALDSPEWSPFEITVRRTAGAPPELPDDAPTIVLRAVIGLRQVRNVPAHIGLFAARKIRAGLGYASAQPADAELGLYRDQQIDLSDWIEGYQRRWLVGPQPDSVLQSVHGAIGMAADLATKGDCG